LQVLTGLKNRGVRDVVIVRCDGLKGLRDSAEHGKAGGPRTLARMQRLQRGGIRLSAADAADAVHPRPRAPGFSFV